METMEIFFHSAGLECKILSVIIIIKFLHPPLGILESLQLSFLLSRRTQNNNERLLMKRRLLNKQSRFMFVA